MQDISDKPCFGLVPIHISLGDVTSGHATSCKIAKSALSARTAGRILALFLRAQFQVEILKLL
jgi:hypothetical protein